VLISSERLEGFLWTIEKGERKWNVHHCDIPALSFVIGHTGVRASTGPLVEKVRKLVESSRDAALAVDRIGEITLDGADAMRACDKVRLGRLMEENDRLLNLLGVGHPALTRLVDACEGISYGAKLTGAGGGGSMLALTDRPADVSEAIRNAGGTPIEVRVGVEGVRVDAAWPADGRGKR
jgi:mevalonate kinase